MTRILAFPDPDAGEPARDERLGALLRDAVGDPPTTDVDWSALAERVSAAVRSPAASPWWSHVGRWHGRALPLAIAAGLVGLLALWSGTAVARAEAAATSTGDVASALLGTESTDDAARSLARTITGTSDLVSSVPE